MDHNIEKSNHMLCLKTILPRSNHQPSSRTHFSDNAFSYLLPLFSLWNPLLTWYFIFMVAFGRFPQMVTNKWLI